MLNQTQPDPRFDPTWRDDQFASIALLLNLQLPKDTPRNGRIWVQSNWERSEALFGESYQNPTPRRVTAIIKPSDKGKYYTLRDQDGQTHDQTSPLLDVIFPPKAWMSDSVQERCMTYAAAKLARGKVLVGGLGLAIYPQFALLFGEALASITVVESSPDVMAIVGDSWFEGLRGKRAIQLHLVQETIENYLQQSTELFDTIYLDTWEDADARFLPHVNYLIQLARAVCAPDGQIHAWSYAMMVDTFVRDARMYVDQAFDLSQFHLDPALQAFADWRAQQTESTLTPETIERVAREIALTTVAPLADYNREQCFTPYATSHHESRLNWLLARKTPIEE
jgi:spermidine synthase